MNRILNNIERIPISGCWIYLGQLNRNGYGTFLIKRKRKMVQRYVYENLVGPIPEGYVLDHLCRVRCCCNPAHLEPVTVQENTRRGNALLFTPTQV